MRADASEIVKAIDAVIAKEIRIGRAAATLGFSVRHLRRLLHRYLEDGPDGVKSRHQGRPGSRLPDALKDETIEIVTRLYPDFGPTLASEKLLERHHIRVSRETLRKWMIAAGLWQDCGVRRGRLHQLREPSPRRGMLVQIDGSHHKWFESRGPKCALIVFIDDATSELGCLHFAESESALAYMVGLQKFIERKGKPVALFSDRHSVFHNRHANLDRTDGTTQFGAVLNRLQIAMICAETSQAKGRVERVNRTLQDRLLKELRLRDISTIDAANEFANEYIEMFNSKFAKPPINPIDAYSSCDAPEVSRWIRWEETRKVSQMLAFQYNKVRFILDDTPMARRAVGKSVVVCEYPDGRVVVEFEGQALSYRWFDKLRRVNQPVVDSKDLELLIDRIDRDHENRNALACPIPTFSGPELSVCQSDPASNDEDGNLSIESVLVGEPPLAVEPGQSSLDLEWASRTRTPCAKRKVSRNLTFQYKNVRYILTETPEIRLLIGEYVEIHETTAGNILVENFTLAASRRRPPIHHRKPQSLGLSSGLSGRVFHTLV